MPPSGSVGLHTYVMCMETYHSITSDCLGVETHMILIFSFILPNICQILFLQHMLC